MTFEMLESTLNINLDAISTLALAALLLLLGYFVRGKVGFLEKFVIPAPVVGGFIFMFIGFVGHVSNLFVFNFDTMFQAPFMLAFFTTVGLGASFELLKKGGKLLVVYWLICGIVSIIQNVIGIGVSKITGLEAPYLLVSSAISMIGGHGAAAAYGTTFEEMGYSGAVLVGMAAATFGLISGVLVGGPVAKKLIEKNNLQPSPEDALQSDVENVNVAAEGERTYIGIMKNVTSILFCMAVGTLVSGWVSTLIGMSFPTYVGAMFVAVIVRNLNEKVQFYKFDFPLVESIGDVTLGLYLSMALMSLKLWELADLFGPVLLNLALQVAFLVAASYFIIFRILGSDYDAAVMCSGLLGHGLGATPSAIVNMSAVTEKYGMSRRAFMIVPIVGAFLVDIIYQPATIWFVKTFVEPK